MYNLFCVSDDHSVNIHCWKQRACAACKL